MDEDGIRRETEVIIEYMEEVVGMLEGDEKIDYEEMHFRVEQAKDECEAFANAIYEENMDDE